MHLTRLSRLGAAAASALLGAALAVAPTGAAAAEPPPVRLQGVVTDADTGAPVPGACVEIVHATYLQRLAEVCADADGHYALQGWMLSNAVSVFTRAHAAGYADSWVGTVRNRNAAPALGLAAINSPTRNFKLGRQAGTLQGRVTYPSGYPVGPILLSVYDTQNPAARAGQVWTTPDGTWTLPNLAPGTYLVSVGPIWQTGPFTVTDGGVTTADVTVTNQPPRSPIGVTGTVRDSSGTPVAGAQVSLWASAYGDIATVTTSSDGTYSFTPLTLGLANMRLVARAPGFAEEWSGGKPHPASAAMVSSLPLTEAGYTGDFTLVRETGTVGGTVTDHQGRPVMTSVVLHDGTTLTHILYSGPDGRYRITNVRGGEFTLGFVTGGPVQYVPGKFTIDEADRYSVAPGTEITVDQQLFGKTGVLEVRTVDAGTGEPVEAGCLRVGGFTRCDTAAVRTVEGLWPGPVDLWLDPGTFTEGAQVPVRVEPTGVTTVTVPVRPRMHAELRVARDPDGTVPRLCVRLIAVYGTPQPGLVEQCNVSGAEVVEIIRFTVPVGRFQAFVIPANDTRYGMQWLGVNGGTGEREKAAVLNFRDGAKTVLPTVRLDGVGRLKGFLVNKIAGGNGLTGVRCLRWLPREVGTGSTCLDELGEYEISGLGPYAWPLEFWAGGAAATWSGGAADRSSAVPVQVVAGEIRRYDITLSTRESVLTTSVFGGVPGTATVFSAVTGDEGGSGTTIRNLPAGPVFLHFQGVSVDCWARVQPRLQHPGVRSSVVGGAISIGSAKQHYYTIQPGVNCLPGAPALVAGRGRLPRLDLQLRLTDAVEAAADAATRPAVAAAGMRNPGR